MVLAANRRQRRSGFSCLAVLVILGALAVPIRAEAEYLGADGKALPFQTDEEVLDFLASAEIVWKEKLTAGTNKKKRKVLLERNGVQAHAILRTGYEVKHTSGGGFVDSYESEIAAYLLNRLLGLDSVPPVVRRKGGSLQLWIENATTEAARLRAGEEPPDPLGFERQIQDLRVFDNLIANTDRNPGNILIDSAGRVWFIDHTRSFSGQKELRDPDVVTGCDIELWRNLRDVTDGEIEDSVKGYVGGYLEALLVRRKLLVDLIEQRIQEQGESTFLFTTTSD